jgi:hypothetical protein
MYNSFSEDFEAEPVGWTPSVENLGAFQPIYHLDLIFRDEVYLRY